MAVSVAASVASAARSDAKGQKTVYFVTYTMTIPYFQNLAAGLKAEAKKLGFKLVVSAANFDAAQRAPSFKLRSPSRRTRLFSRPSTVRHSFRRQHRRSPPGFRSCLSAITSGRRARTKC